MFRRVGGGGLVVVNSMQGVSPRFLHIGEPGSLRPLLLVGRLLLPRCISVSVLGGVECCWPAACPA